MREKIQKIISNHYFLSFILPAIIMLGYFAYRKMAPFGNSSILTVDLGQQYIDMFSGMRETILHNPHQLFYSFGKNFGGEMFSEWSYYLFSPLNLLLLFFNQANLPSGILLLTVLRFGLSGLSMQCLLVKRNFASKNLALVFSSSYALSGWFIANQVNLLWQDEIILLPLIIYFAISAILEKKYLSFTLIFAFSIIDNFYIAYMIGVFLPFFALWQISRQPSKILSWFISMYRFLLAMFGSVLVAAVVLLPTAYQLLQGKGQDTIAKIDWQFIAKPYLLILKLIPGSFNFSQMKTGQANIFMPFVIIIGLIAYFFLRKEKISTKIIAGFTIGLYGLSFIWQPLNIFFHMMQYPVWYPYRYSFIFIFFVLLLAAIGLQQSRHANLKTFVLSAGLIFGITLTAFIYDGKIDFVDQQQVHLFIFVSVFGLFVYLIRRYMSFNFWSYFLLLVALTSSALNAYLSTNNFSYLTNSEYQRTIQALRQSTSNLSKKGFYRVGQTFSRTRGDPFATGFNGGMHFSSTVDKKTPELFGAFGQAAGDYVASYSYGTILTDAIFDMKYFISPVYGSSTAAGSSRSMANSYRPDLTNYQLLQSKDQTMTIKNNNALPIVFPTSKQVLKSQIYPENPILTANSLWTKLANTKSVVKENIPFTYNTTNLQRLLYLNGQTAEKISNTQDASLNISFTPTTNDAYYLTLPSSFANDASWITINGETIPQDTNRQDVVALNVANQDKNFQITISIHLKNSSLFLNNLTLYSIDRTQVSQAAKKIQKTGITNLKFNQTSFTGNIHAAQDQKLLMTTIPASPGWKIKIDGKNTTVKTIDHYFVGAKINPGKHRIKIYYEEPYLHIALFISVISLFIIIGFNLRKRFTKIN
ncbi:YfhO family protein [Oenococcus sicerae]|uniref:YfhO family protein n=1 Tax=Oenococcus sicerae TaxID=2203724 RepID=UPI0010BAFFCC|nr:hypothetical protein OAL24_01048 [Oenococcus sicerae]